MSKKKLWIGVVSLGLALLMALVVRMASVMTPRPETLAKRIQQSVVRLDKKLDVLMASGCEASALAKEKVGLVVFEGDSLLYWNTNEVSPRILKRRVTVGNDTICNLLSGDYYVKSRSEGNRNVYLFRLVNSTYRIENEFFENRYWLLPNFINAKIAFQSEEGFAIKDSSGKSVGVCQITAHPGIKRRQVVVMEALIGILALFGICSLLFSNRTIRAHFTGRTHRSTLLQWGMVMMVLVALASMLTYAYYKVKKEHEDAYMKTTAERLLANRDAGFETSYRSFLENVRKDVRLKEMIFDESNVLAEVILGYAQELLFEEDMKSYSVSLTVCDPDEEITIQPEGYVSDCDDYFMGKLANSDRTILGEGLFYVNYYTLDPNYLSKIKVYAPDSTCFKTLYFEFYKPIVPEGFGYPRLLQEKNSDAPYDYSVASYADSILIYKYGKYIYPNFLKDFNYRNGNFTYDRTYKHYTLTYGQNNALVISNRRKGWSEITAPFAAFFLLLMIPVAVFLICRPKQEKEWQGSFGKKLQWIVIVSMAVSFLVIGPISVLYMNRLYNQKNADAQFEKTQSILREMETDYNLELLQANASRSVLTEMLQQFAETFFTELNLYALDGKLLATSRQEIFENHLQAPLMNPLAYRNLHKHHALYFSHEEHLGKGSYESAYVPIIDNGGCVVAYLNTPYFSSKVDLQSEVNNFILNYLNIILLLLCVAILVVVYVTNRLNKPLMLIQDKMRDVRLDKNNEPINWKSNDEIGALIEQYNKLIVKLERSANLIARNERESTWREMARQVAHEIKNPLTPMQLSVQYLVKAYNDGAEDLGDRLKRTATTLLEQIEALSEIASAFSNFAKLPENHPENLELSELLQGVVNLYDVEENIRFVYTFDERKSYAFVGDKTNLNRAFGNVVKNAVQAIGTKADGRIEVLLEAMEQKYVITIRDNGKGIREEDKKKIFLPNFTTKSSGTGLGLAMVYNIMQVAGGRINFESEEGKGTAFVVELFKDNQVKPLEG